MIRSIAPLLGALLFFGIHTSAQYNIDFVGQLDYQDLRNSDLSNLWGYTDETGIEYAIVGVNGNSNDPGGVSVVSLADPADPQEVFFFPGPSSIWREVKVWGDHAYVTTEAENGGVTIIDLSPLPQSTTLPTTVFNDPDWITAHSLFIDETGRMYIFGSSSGNGGAIMYDLTQDPMAPVEVGQYDQWYVHDGFARGDTLYAAHIYDGFFTIVDVSDPASPVILGSQATPDLFTHNVWLDDSGDHLFTTDEKNNAYVASYDISDPSDIEFLDKLQSDAGANAVPHNTYWLNDYLVTSYYTYGVTIYDATYPHNLVEVGHFDTSPLEGEGFNGAWGVYPFFSSDRLIISDIQEGLFVLDATFVRAAFLEGTVTNANSGAPISQATVNIVGPGVSTISNGAGYYATGYHLAGSYTVTVSAPGYQTATFDGVVLDNGVVALLDVELVPLETFVLQGTITDAVTGGPIEGALVDIRNELYWFTSQTDANGQYVISAIYEDTYQITAGLWGWRTHCNDQASIAPGSVDVNISLQPGYYDDFQLDLGWMVTSSASSGAWVRAVPAGTFYQNVPAAPGSDVADDCGNMAMVTGNGGGSAGNDDLDEGWTKITSPVFDVSGMSDPYVRYHRWFFNAGGSGAINDHMEISLDNGATTAVIETINGAGTGMWQLAEIPIADHIQPTSSMQFIVRAADDEPGHLVEAGLDRFVVFDMGTIGVEEKGNGSRLHVWPNPSNGTFMITDPGSTVGMITVHDALGRTVAEPQAMRNGQLEMELDLSPGTYLLRSIGSDGSLKVQPIVIR